MSLLAGPSTVADVRQVLLLHRAQSRLFPTVDGCQVLVLLRALCRDDCGQDLERSFVFLGKENGIVSNNDFISFVPS